MKSEGGNPFFKELFLSFLAALLSSKVVKFGDVLVQFCSLCCSLIDFPVDCRWLRQG